MALGGVIPHAVGVYGSSEVIRRRARSSRDKRAWLSGGKRLLGELEINEPFVTMDQASIKRPIVMVVKQTRGNARRMLFRVLLECSACLRA